MSDASVQRTTLKYAQGRRFLPHGLLLLPEPANSAATLPVHSGALRCTSY